MCVCAREREKLVLTWQADGRLHSTLTQAWTHIRSSGSVYASDHLTAPTTAQTHLTTTITKTLRFTCECNKCSVIKPVELIIRMMCECIYSYDNQGLTRGTKKGESWTTSKLEGRLNSCFRQHSLFTTYHKVKTSSFRSFCTIYFNFADCTLCMWICCSDEVSGLVSKLVSLYVMIWGFSVTHYGSVNISAKACLGKVLPGLFFK